METSNSTVTGSDTFSTGRMNWLYLLNNLRNNLSSPLEEKQPGKRQKKKQLNDGFVCLFLSRFKFNSPVDFVYFVKFVDFPDLLDPLDFPDLPCIFTLNGGKEKETWREQSVFGEVFLFHSSHLFYFLILCLGFHSLNSVLCNQFLHGNREVLVWPWI